MDTMTPSSLLAELEQQGIHISAEDDQLHLDGPSGSLIPELRAVLVAQKPVILKYLRHQQNADRRPVIDNPPKKLF